MAVLQKKKKDKKKKKEVIKGFKGSTSNKKNLFKTIFLQKVYVKDLLHDFFLSRTQVRAAQVPRAVLVTATRKINRKRRRKRRKRSHIKSDPHRNRWGLLSSRKRFLHVLLFQEKPDGDQSTEPKTDPGSAGPKLSLQGAGDSGPTPGLSSTQLLVKADPLDPSPAASDPPAARSPVGPREPVLIRRPPSPMASLLDRYGDTGSRSSTHLTSTDLLKTSRFYQK